MIGGRRPLQGRKPGDRRVRVERPHAALFRWTGPGQLTAKEAASAPTTPRDRFVARLKGVLLGRPLASEEEIGERLSKKKALAIFSSDAISSSAYATEEILRVLILGGVVAMAWGLWVSVAIAVLLIAVAFSYRQVCLAYPTGGGSYSVSKRNFGRMVSLIAASALMIDYVMTVAVSTASAIEQVTSAVPGLVDERVALGILAIALITLGNLRGLREAGNIFAIPTYLFLGSALLMIAIGTFRIVVLGEHQTYNETVLAKQVGDSFQTLSVILLLRAFAAGAVALTGTEAIATGVPAFQPPEAKNASTTLAVMAALLGVLFIGLTFLAVNFGISHIEIPEQQTVISQIARRIYGDGHDPVLPVPGVHRGPARPGGEHELQRVPAPPRDPRHRRPHAPPVLVPRRPARLQLRDHRPRHGRGVPDLVLPGRDPPDHPALRGRGVHRLHDQPGRHDPPLAPGAAAGLATAARDQRVRLHPDRDRRGRRHDRQGAPVADRHRPRSRVSSALMWFDPSPVRGRRRRSSPFATTYVVGMPHREQRVVIPVNGINRAVVQAVIVRPDPRERRPGGLHHRGPRRSARQLRRKWERQVPGVPLVIVESPYRALVGPLTAYLDVLDLAWPPDKDAPITIVVLPEYVARHWWDRLLYNQSAKRLKSALVGREHTVIADVPYRRGH